MAELVDAVDSKSAGSNTVRVQVPLCPPNPDFLKNLCAKARFLLPSEARSKGENGPQDPRTTGMTPLFFCCPLSWDVVYSILQTIP